MNSNSRRRPHGGGGVPGLVIAALLVAAPFPASGQQLADEAGVDGSLRRARLRVEPVSATRARVSVALELGGGGPVDLLLAYFAGQSVHWLRAEADGVAFEPGAGSGDGSAVHRIRVPAGPGARPAAERSRSVYLDYEVTVPAARGYRFPLPVPDAPVDPAGHSVTIEVLLPVGTRYAGDGFPGFDRVEESAGGQVLRGRPVAVPAFAHVVFAETPGSWPMPLRVQAAAVVLTLVPLALFGLWLRWRHRGRAATPAGGRTGAGSRAGGRGAERGR